MATISGIVFEDLNRNQMQDPDEYRFGVSHQAVYLDDNDNGKLDLGETYTFTDSEGKYSLFNVPQGFHVLRVFSFFHTNHHRIFLAENDSYTGHFLAYAATSIFGTVFDDLNGNGVQDTNEAGILGSIVYLDLNKNGQLDDGDISATTDSDGDYFLRHTITESGVFLEVRQVVPSGYKETSCYKRRRITEIGPGN